MCLLLKITFRSEIHGKLFLEWELWSNNEYNRCAAVFMCLFFFQFYYYILQKQKKIKYFIDNRQEQHTFSRHIRLVWLHLYARIRDNFSLFFSFSNSYVFLRMWLVYFLLYLFYLLFFFECVHVFGQRCILLGLSVYV